jgi:hypothetical protein
MASAVLSEMRVTFERRPADSETWLAAYPKSCEDVPRTTRALRGNTLPIVS